MNPTGWRILLEAFLFTLPMMIAIFLSTESFIWVVVQQFVFKMVVPLYEDFNNKTRGGKKDVSKIWVSSCPFLRLKRFKHFVNVSATNNHVVGTFEHSVESIFQMVHNDPSSKSNQSAIDVLEYLLSEANLKKKRRIRYIEEIALGLSDLQWDVLLDYCLKNSTESKVISILFKVLPFIELTKPSSSSYPEEILVANGLAIHLLTNFRTDMVDLYYEARVHSLFLKMLRNETNNGEFNIVQRASILFFNKFGYHDIKHSIKGFSTEEKTQALVLLDSHYQSCSSLIIPSSFIRLYYRYNSDKENPLFNQQFVLVFWFLFSINFSPCNDDGETTVYSRVNLFLFYATIEYVLNKVCAYTKALTKRNMTDWRFIPEAGSIFLHFTTIAFYFIFNVLVDTKYRVWTLVYVFLQTIYPFILDGYSNDHIQPYFKNLAKYKDSFKPVPDGFTFVQ
ncbi:hypothetical protein DFA_00251 [Cavenderia fasciculata]|uniref:Transmembrane protein n=1 Tax=Cavenderia fasciculata TaxID=261658 RepID=F4PY13_CACFS|nr:uncharacterized protein DFA_00251 [Cavenderia fasciculata]EGG19673.1 hypothetical protein DFA_00251 [Cavenderia fasciculata]|eukprot:XP_004357967.1 hypothetical protein DFA_00251 [Cavenderia fasciculata]